LQLGGEASLPVCAGWSELLLFFTRWKLHCPSAVPLFGQLLSQQGGAIQFEYCPLSHKVSSGIHHLPRFGRLAFWPTPALSLCASPDLCLVLAVPLGGWLVTSPHCSYLLWLTSVSSLRVQLLAPPLFSGEVSEFHLCLCCWS
jgi:hypothetical protein